MIKVKLSIPKDVFAAARELPTRATRNFNREIDRVVKPELQRHVKDLVAVSARPGCCTPSSFRLRAAAAPSLRRGALGAVFRRGVPMP